MGGRPLVRRAVVVRDDAPIGRQPAGVADTALSTALCRSDSTGGRRRGVDVGGMGLRQRRYSGAAALHPDLESAGVDAGARSVSWLRLVDGYIDERNIGRSHRPSGPPRVGG